MNNTSHYKLLIDKLKAGLLWDLGATLAPWYGDDLLWRQHLPAGGGEHGSTQVSGHPVSPHQPRHVRQPEQ